MSRYEGLIDPAVVDYVLTNSVHEPEILARLREETAKHPKSNFQIPPEQGQLMRVLVRMSGAKNVIEVGVFTGYSSLSVALALPADGRILACDISDEYTHIARRYWAEAEVTNKIDLRIGPASQTLDKVIAEGGSGKYDFAFIDADKTGYPGYYEQCLKLLRRGGTMALDNMLSRGRVMNPATDDPDAGTLAALNRSIYQDTRVDAMLLPFGDGLTLAVKK
jgi:predicted O-methyltransferase YrrM